MPNKRLLVPKDSLGGLPHVCFVAPHAFPMLSGDYTEQLLGGAELQQVFLARELAIRNYKVSMVCLDFGQADGMEIDGIKIHKAFHPNAGLRILRFFHPRLTSLWSCIKVADADIYYTRTASILTGIVAAFSRIYGRKTVFSGADDTDFSMRKVRVKYRRDRWIYHWGLKNTDYIVVQNESQLKLCRQNFKRNAKTIKNMWPDQNHAVRRKLGNSVLWVSTIRQIKRPERLVQLARMLPELKFVMVGGPDKSEQALFNKTRTIAEQEANIDFVGFVPFTEVGQYFDDARVFVNTSESEGFPNAFLQSWIRSVPTVSFVDCGARLGADRIGFCVESVSEMANIVRRMFDDEADYRRVGDRCRQYCIENHSIESVVKEYEEIFRECVGT